MHKLLVWVGTLLCSIGAAVVVASVVFASIGYNASFNLGDSTKFEFVLIPFWQLGLAAAVLGVGSLLAARMLKRPS
jgi:predicted cation transporter